MPDALMLFAAGFGTRMGALTADRPKPLIAVAGRALIDHALDLATDAGIARIVVNTHYRAEQLHAHLSGRGVAISHEAGAILDTGGGLRKALPLLGADTVFTLNSDAIWTGPNPLRRLADAWDPDRMDALLLLVAADAARGYRGTGDFALDAEGRVSRAGPSVYTGAQIVRTDLLGDIAEETFSLNRVWDRAIAAGRLFGVLHAGGWCDVGHPGGIAEAEAMLAGAHDG
ncbi:nucleotidyltransferase family protein [Rhodovulum steppense]|uniref:MurNAc alpha-1-phosphate uridylyltransferase n=1 Tax=Rhodovulum steppense TaxID=540251 RepID=A0A4R1YPW1_9RHOB|nr:nucleotidyltransferase family protein [Rhodovulum steppense]TCM79995.1 MurNAc alpha-1-phosphate uridylyltransferase [Rhodovulum steppense]